MKPPICECCGKSIQWPPLDYGSPPPWSLCGVREEELPRRVRLTRDVCVVDDGHFFVRANVDIPVLDGPGGTFAWGVWGSLSRASFDRVMNLLDDPDQASEPPFFSWLSSYLPCYAEPTAPVKARMHLRGPGRVPLLEVHPDHPLGQEQINGITLDRVREFARKILGSDEPPEKHPSCE